MKRRLMDILADPDNNEIWPLKLLVFKSRIEAPKIDPKPHESTGLYCKFYCHKKDKFLVTDPNGENEKTLPREELDKIVKFDECKECNKEVIEEAVIYHNHNDEIKWFPVIDEITVMYPLELREYKYEIKFLKKHHDELKKLGITKPIAKMDEKE